MKARVGGATSAHGRRPRRSRMRFVPRSTHLPWVATLVIALLAAPVAVRAGSRGGTDRSARGAARTARPAPAPAARARGAAERPARGSAIGAASGTASYGYGHRPFHRYGSAYYGGPYWFGHYRFGLYGYYPYFYPYPYVAVTPVAWPADGPSAAVIETVVSPRRAEVWVDGEYRGEARDFSGRWDRLWLEPGVHLVELRKDEYLTLQRHVRLGSGDYYRIDERLGKGDGIDPRSTLEPPAGEDPVARPDIPAPDRPPAGTDRGQPGFLTFEVSPADAVVYIDGEFLARADELARLHGAIPVAIGDHVIEVVRPGYRSVRHVVEAVGDGPRGVRIDLEADETD